VTIGFLGVRLLRRVRALLDRNARDLDHGAAERPESVRPAFQGQRSIIDVT
jgi:hypothetical protein